MKKYDHKDNKYNNNMRRWYNKRSEGLHNFIVLVCLVLSYGMYHIKNLKVTDLKVLLIYHFQLEKLR